MERENKELFIIHNRKLLNGRAFCIKLFTNVKLPEIEIKKDKDGNFFTEEISRLDLVGGELFCEKGKPDNKFGFISELSDEIESTGVVLHLLETRKDRPICHVQCPFTVEKGDIENLKKEKVESTFGEFYINEVLLALPFGSKFEYICGQKEWAPKSISKWLYKRLLDTNDETRMTIDEYNEFVNRHQYVGNFSELSVATFSRKTLNGPPNVKELKEKLKKKYGDKLYEDPLLQLKFEDELIQADKDNLKGDPGEDYLACNSKGYNVTRKKMYSCIGGIEKFDSKGNSYEFIEKSLQEGWDKKLILKISSELRKGSYDRGTETAKGGEQNKFLSRVFQEVAIVEDDCKTKRGIPVKNASEKRLKELIYRNIFYNGKEITITDENYQKFIGKSFMLRSPSFCKSKNGFCFKCCGEIYKKMGKTNIGLDAIKIGTTFLSISMASMHGTKLSAFEIDKISNFIIMKE